jgi:hypothetical protein
MKSRPERRLHTASQGLRASWCDRKNAAARDRSARGRDCDVPRLCAGGNRGRHLRCGVEQEARLHPAKGNFRRLQADTGNSHRRSRRAGGWREARDLGLDLEYLIAGSVVPEVVTVTEPVVASAGTVAVTSVEETNLEVAVVPLKATLLVLVKPFPKITTFAPTLPEVVSISTNGCSPDKLKTVPSGGGANNDGTVFLEAAE